MRTGVLSAACVAAVSLLAGPGCAGSASSQPQSEMCPRCLDLAREVRRSEGVRAGHHRTEVVLTHQCPDCKTVVVGKVENGVPTIHCSVCAPNGRVCPGE